LVETAEVSEPLQQQPLAMSLELEVTLPPETTEISVVAVAVEPTQQPDLLATLAAALCMEQQAEVEELAAMVEELEVQAVRAARY
jgi:hypothetical protein